jgi:hypothetical protein
MDAIEKFDTMRDLMMRKIFRHRSYGAVFSTKEGAEVLAHICREGFVFKTTFVAGDPQQTALNEGSRRLALSILRMAGMNHEQQVQFLERELENL